MTKKCVRLSAKKREKIISDLQHVARALERLKDKLSEHIKNDTLMNHGDIFSTWIELCRLKTIVACLSYEKMFID